MKTAFKKFWQKHRTILLANTLINLVLLLIIVGGAVLVVGEGGISWPGRQPAGAAVPGPDPQTEETAITRAVAAADPAVVSIIVTKDVPRLEQYFDNLDPFEGLFGGGAPFGMNFLVPRLRENGTERREVGGGSGFIVSADGLVVTNKHVVADEEASYTVFTNDNKKWEATVIARDPVFDIAVLRIRGEGFSYLEFGDSDHLRPGQFVVAIGNALGEFRNSISLGVVSGLSRSVVAGDERGNQELLEEVIQTDAAINPGNSGGPLLDLSGRVVGVNVAVALGSENIGFALPANLVKEVVESVKTYGEIVRPYLGIRYQAITKSLQEKNHLPFDYGVLVSRGATPEELAVIPGSPADKAGIRENDIILEFDGHKITAEKTLAGLIRQKSAGDKARLLVWHQGATKEILVTLERFPE